jgi:hypothetical protein
MVNEMIDDLMDKTFHIVLFKILVVVAVISFIFGYIYLVD